MDLTVADALDAIITSKAKVVAGNNGLNRVVTGINIIESKNIMKVIKGGEILITSLYPNMLEPYTRGEFCEILATANVSAIAVKLGNCFDEIPQEVLEMGNKYDMPIIELPDGCNFSEIIHLVILALYDRRSLKLQIHENVFKRFSDIIIENQGLQVLMNEFSFFLKKALAVTNGFGRVVATTSDSFNNDFDMVVPIQNKGGAAEGYLHIDSKGSPLTEAEEIVLEDGLRMIFVELLKLNAIQEVENRYKNDLLDVLVSGRAFDEDNIYEKMEHAGWELKGFFRVVFMELKDSELTQHTKKDVAYYVTERMHEIKLEATQVFVRAKTGMLYVIVQNKDQDALAEKTDELVNEVKLIMRKYYQEISYHIGIGDTVSRLIMIATSYNHAVKAMHIGKNENWIVTDYNKIGLLKALYDVNDSEAIREMIPENILLLQAYDSEKGTDFLLTLKTFFECNCNASMAAEYLYIHYKTMLNRLKRIKELTGWNPEDSEERLESEIGIKVLQLLSNRS